MVQGPRPAAIRILSPLSYRWLNSLAWPSSLGKYCCAAERPLRLGRSATSTVIPRADLKCRSPTTKPLPNCTNGPTALRFAAMPARWRRPCVWQPQRYAPGGDETQWAITGLLHDADYDRWPEEHPRLIVAWLLEQDEPAIAQAVLAHFNPADIPELDDSR